MKISSIGSSLQERPQKAEQLAPKIDLGQQIGPIRPLASNPSGAKIDQAGDATAAAVEDMVDEVNKVLHYINERLQFSVHETTKRIMVKVVDRETDEVLREIPPEKLLDLVGKLQEIVGLLVDQKA